jgi:dienelactone hydrolase
MKFKTLLSAYIFLIFCSCNSSSDEDSTNESSTTQTEAKTPKIQEASVTYTIDSLNLNNYVAYDENVEGKRPAVLVIHEWWGLNDYAKRRAKMLAEMGYIAMAVDMYGNGRMGNDPGAAQNLAMPYYQHPDMAKKIFDRAVEELKKNPNVDQTKMAGIGYCFGGGMLLNFVRMGEPLNGIVSFHGSLLGTPANKDLTKAEILICHGEADDFVNAEVAPFKKQMDSIGKSYTFKSYPGATHAFTNPAATETGKKFKMPIEYNAAADSASWKDMKDFFGKIFK